MENTVLDSNFTYRNQIVEWKRKILLYWQSKAPAMRRQLPLLRMEEQCFRILYHLR